MRVIVDLVAFEEYPLWYDFELPDCFCQNDNVLVAEHVFEATNLHSGPVWDRIEPNLPEERNHTALSVGDMVTVRGQTFRCEPAGWSEVNLVTSTMRPRGY
jgi:hypothetical protein